MVVFNTPGANANSVKELVLAGLLLGARDLFGGMQFVSQLDGSLTEKSMNAEVEAEKKKFRGSEIKGKTLGVLGLGAIGSRVARAALDLSMEVVGFDPAISVDAAWRLPAEVQRVENMQSLFARSDYITLHVPLLDATRGMINSTSLKAFKPGAVLLNFSRQPIVESVALKTALDEGDLRLYIADFPVPELAGHPSVRLMPHLGASTTEAEENCAVMAANQLADFLENGNITNSVNFPRVQLARSEAYRIALTNRNVPKALGDITSVLAERNINVVDMLNQSRDALAYNLIDIETAPDAGLLEEFSGLEAVVNVRVFDRR